MFDRHEISIAQPIRMATRFRISVREPTKTAYFVRGSFGDTLPGMVRIIERGDWREGTVTTEQVATTRRIEPEIEHLIDTAWSAASARPGVHLFDGPMCRLETFNASANSLHLQWSLCSYRTFLGTNMSHPELFDRFGPDVLANPIGLSVLIVTFDRQLILGRRNDSVAYYPGRVHPIAGSLEPTDASPFAGIRRELCEELNLSEEVTTLRCIGLVEDASLRQMEMIFVAEVATTADEIEHSLDAAEHRGLWRCDANEQSVSDALRAVDGFTPVAVGTLTLYLVNGATPA